MENLFNFTPIAIAAIPVALGLVEVAKQAGLPSRFAPIMSIVIGIGLLFLTGQTWQLNVIQGIIVGLAACGLWSGPKALFAPRNQEG